VAEPVPGPITDRFGALARTLDVWILLGSVVERSADAGDDRASNTSVLVSPAGAIAAVYRKIHLFDVDLPGRRLRESETIAPGDRLVVADVDGWRLGLQVCYDLRFAEAAIGLRGLGAEIIAYPSNFTRRTGLAHWAELLAARATDTGCFVVAPAQWGVHPGLEIEAHGRARILDPWATILAERTFGDGIAVATLRRARLAEVRSRLPVADHRRPNAYKD
jgi:predicted amidohydrolase